MKTENEKVAEVKVVENVKIPHRPSWMPKNWGINSGKKETGPYLKSMTIKNGVNTGMIHGISSRK